MTKMTGPDCAVMCNLINTHTHTHTHTHRITRMAGPDCVVMCNLINTRPHAHTQHGEEDTPMLGLVDARRLGGRYAGKTDLIPLR